MSVKALAYVLVGMVIGQITFLASFGSQHFLRWAAAWTLVTIVVFTTPSFMGLVVVLILIGAWSYWHPIHGGLVHFCLLLPAVPFELEWKLPGLLPGIEQLVTLNYPRLLTLTLLVPFGYRLWSSRTDLRVLVKHSIDVVCLLNIAYFGIMGFRDLTFTNALRFVIHDALCLYIPYFVFSRGVRKLDDFKRIFLAILYGAVLLGMVGILESAKSWLLYREVPLYGDQPAFYLHRSGMLRIEGPFLQPIPFGFFLILGLASLIYLADRAWNQRSFLVVACGILVLSGILTLTRMTWIGMALFVAIWNMLEAKGRIKRVFLAGAAALVILPALSLLPFAHELVDKLPFVGSTDQDTVGYRRLLVDQSWKVISENPFFGNPDWRAHPELEVLYQNRPNGPFLDVVNTYLLLAFPYGLVGAGLFFAFQVTAILLVWRSILDARRRGDTEWVLLGRLLVAINVDIVFMINTASPISYTEIYIWIILSLSSAYVSLSPDRTAADVSGEGVEHDP